MDHRPGDGQIVWQARAGPHPLPALSDQSVREALPEFGKYGRVDGYQQRYATNQEGAYRVVGLPGRAILGVQCVLTAYPSGMGHETIKGLDKHGHFPTYRNPVEPGKKWPTAMKEVVVSADAKQVRCDFQLEAGRSIKVTAVDPQGRELRGLEVAGKGDRGYWQPVESATFDAVAFAPAKSGHCSCISRRSNSEKFCR